MTDSVPSPRQALRILGWLGLLLLFVYGASLKNGFVDWDDPLLIVENPVVQDLSPSSVKQAFTRYDPELYIPLTFLSYQLTYALAGLHPFLYHLGNLLLHILNAGLVAWFILLLTGNRWIAAVTTLLFAVHPLNTEAVAWASARKDVLSAFFFLLSLNAYLVFRRTSLRKWYLFSIFSHLLALLSKVSALSLPFVLLLIDWREGRKVDRSYVWEKLPFFALSVLFGIVALGGKGGNGSLLFTKMLVGSKAVIFTIGKLFFPAGLSVLYPFTEPLSPGNPHLFLPLVAVVVLCVLAWVSRRATREILFAWLFFLAALAPSFANIAKGEDLRQDIYFASDRYAYIPGVALLFLAALLFHRFLHRRPKAVQGAVAAVVFLFALRAHAQSLVWKDSESLFTNVLRFYPNSHVAHNNIGSLRYREGKIEEALSEYGASLAIRPNGMAYYNMGQYFSDVGRTEDALLFYRRALEQRPADVKTLLNLAVMEMRIGDEKGAIEHLLRARGLDDSLASVHYNLGVAYGKLGRREEALASLRNVLKINPDNREVQELVSKLER